MSTPFEMRRYTVSNIIICNGRMGNWLIHISNLTHHLFIIIFIAIRISWITLDAVCLFIKSKRCIWFPSIQNWSNSIARGKITTITKWFRISNCISYFILPMINNIDLDSLRLQFKEERKVHRTVLFLIIIMHNFNERRQFCPPVVCLCDLWSLDM